MRSGQEKLKKINTAYDTLKRHFASLDSRQAPAKPTPASPSTKSEPAASTSHREKTSSEDYLLMTCSHCLKKIRFLKKSEGKSGKCAACGAVIKLCRSTKEEGSTNPQPQKTTEPPPASRSTKSDPASSANHSEKSSSVEDYLLMTCSHCLKKIKFQKQWEGKSGKCAECGAVIKLCRDKKEESSSNPQPKKSDSKPERSSPAPTIKPREVWTICLLVVMVAIFWAFIHFGFSIYWLALLNTITFISLLSLLSKKNRKSILKNEKVGGVKALILILFGALAVICFAYFFGAFK